jgi:hypothetical protein
VSDDREAQDRAADDLASKLLTDLELIHPPHRWMEMKAAIVDVLRGLLQERGALRADLRQSRDMQAALQEALTTKDADLRAVAKAAQKLSTSVRVACDDDADKWLEHRERLEDVVEECDATLSRPGVKAVREEQG